MIIGPLKPMPVYMSFHYCNQVVQRLLVPYLSGVNKTVVLTPIALQSPVTRYSLHINIMSVHISTLVLTYLLILVQLCQSLPQVIRLSRSLLIDAEYFNIGYFNTGACVPPDTQPKLTDWRRLARVQKSGTISVISRKHRCFRSIGLNLHRLISAAIGRWVTSDLAELPFLPGRKKLCTGAIEYNP